MYSPNTSSLFLPVIVIKRRNITPSNKKTITQRLTSMIQHNGNKMCRFRFFQHAGRPSGLLTPLSNSSAIEREVLISSVKLGSIRVMNTEQRRDSWPHSRSVEKLKELILNQHLTERTRLLGSSSMLNNLDHFSDLLKYKKGCFNHCEDKQNLS